MMILFKCNLCSNQIKKLFQDKQTVSPFLTCACGGVLEKQMPDFGTTSLETVDNGNMMRKVELRKDAVNRFKERGDLYIKNTQHRDKILKKDEV